MTLKLQQHLCLSVYPVLLSIFQTVCHPDPFFLMRVSAVQETRLWFKVTHVCMFTSGRDTNQKRTQHQACYLKNIQALQGQDKKSLLNQNQSQSGYPISMFVVHSEMTFKLFKWLDGLVTSVPKCMLEEKLSSLGQKLVKDQHNWQYTLVYNNTLWPEWALIADNW